MTRVNGSQRWSLVVDKKISILIALVVLDSPLCQINMSKSNKQRISQTGYYQIFCWNLFKDDTEASAFSDCYYSSLKNENTLTIEKGKHFTKAATEECSSNLCFAAIIKSI